MPIDIMRRLPLLIPVLLGLTFDLKAIATNVSLKVGMQALRWPH